INVVGRAVDSERGTPETLQNLQIVTPSGTSIPLLAFATVRYEILYLLKFIININVYFFNYLK
ncbi:MAG: hypothetical protein Q8769_02565, partial [Candidatus Phytoplasma australasiaticum]|nr:hypothetical protein [Candidatus Phytoplasma australasiaticum]